MKFFLELLMFDFVNLYIACYFIYHLISTYFLQAKLTLIKLVKDALFSMAQVRYSAGDFIKFVFITFLCIHPGVRYNVLESVGTNAPTRVRMRYENVSGVALPTFELEREGFGCSFHHFLQLR